LALEPLDWPDGEHSQRQLELLARLLAQELSESPVLISFLTETLSAAAVAFIESILGKAAGKSFAMIIATRT